jgi:hypothetical protein
MVVGNRVEMSVGHIEMAQENVGKHICTQHTYA